MSLIPNLLVPGIKEAIRLSSAKKYYVGNLMTLTGGNRRLQSGGSSA